MVIYLILLLPLLYILYVKTNHARKLLSKFPGDFAFPLIGNAYQFGSKPSAIHAYLLKMAKKYNFDAFKVYMGPQLLLFITKPEDIKMIINNPKCMNKMYEYSFFKPWLGESVLFTKGEKWKNTRRILLPSFSNKVLDSFKPIFEGNVDLFIKHMAKLANGKIHDVNKLVSLCTLDIISEVATGKSLNAQEKSGNEIIDAYEQLCDIFIVRLFSSWKTYDCLFRLTNDYKTETKLAKIVRGYINNLIIRRRTSLIDEGIAKELINLEEDNRKIKSNFLDMLLMSTIDDRPLTNEEIINEVCTMIFAGHDTITAAICHSLYVLSQNPEIQEKLFQEQHEIVESSENENGNNDEKFEMSYLELFMKEVLRMHPSAPLIGRFMEEDIEITDGRILPAGTNALVLIYALHRNPKYFKDPEKINPDRFLPENWLEEHSHAYLPFSAGLRNCLGIRYATREMKFILSKLIRKFEFCSAGPDNAPISYGAVTLKSENGFNLIIKCRK